MSNDEKAVAKNIMIDHAGGLALALLVSFALSWVIGFFGIEGEITGNISFFLFFVLLFADPVGAWRGAQSWPKFWVKMGSGLIVAVILAAMFNLIDFEAAYAPAEEGEAGERGDGSGMIGLVLWPMLIIAVVFLGPMIERILSGKGPTGAPLTRDDLLIGLTFPLYITGSFALTGVVAGALWLIGVPWSVGVLVLTAGVLSAVAEAWFAQPEDHLPDGQEDGGWQARAESGAAAWAGLRKAMRASLSSALVMGGMMYATVALPLSLNVSGEVGFADEGLALLGDLLLFLGLAMVCSLGLLMYAGLLTITLAFVVGRMHGIDPLSLEAFAKQCMGRLFMGGMAYVRPDIDEET